MVIIVNKSRIYNVIFPIWFLVILPLGWLFILPINFIIDSFALLLILKIMKLDIKSIYSKVILRVWLFGFLADLIGALFLLLLDFAPLGDLFSNLYWNPYENICAILIITVALLMSGFFIYYFNYKYSLKKIDMEVKSKKKIALFMAIFTIPYLFLVPTSFFYDKGNGQFIEGDIVEYSINNDYYFK